ncbi:MAG: TraB/GumN family protein [Gammaproteobacteria bacterium]|nr:TraB/GumN family protein [Gammaproteobacteria bacterium]
MTPEPTLAADAQVTPQSEPIVTVVVNGRKVTLLGTAHVSRASANKVEELLNSGEYDGVAVELCPSRYNSIINPDAFAKMDLFQVLKEKKMPMVAATLALGAYQQRLAEQFDIVPGLEMRTAIDTAKEHQIPVYLIDREIGTTLKRIYRNIPWWQRANLVVGMMSSLFSREEVTEADIERLKEGDVLETTFSQFAADAKELYSPLIDERDQYMAARILQECANHPGENILAVIGAGHMKGMKGYLDKGFDDSSNLIQKLDTIPAPAMWPKFIPWAIVAVILIGFGIGFSRSDEMGWQMVMDWVLINGALCALGAAIAGAHLLTIITAFLAAPLTSLNPTIGAGFVTAGVEILLRKPSVGDFSGIRTASTTLKGWWKNRVTRILLVFILSTLGSAAGTYIAGFKIFSRLTTG